MTTFTPNTPGVFHGLPHAQYLAAPGVSRSMLDHLNPPARLPAYLAKRPPSTDAQDFGSLLHRLILSPDDGPRFAVKPPGMKFSTTAGKEWRAEHEGLEIVDSDDWDKAHAMWEAVDANEDCQAIFAEGSAEVSAFAMEATLPVLRKARLDWVPKKADAPLVDIKTCRDASEAAFRLELWERRYFIQASYYLATWNLASGQNRTRFVFVAIEKEPPYLIACHDLDPADIRRGDGINAARLDTYYNCLRSGNFYGHPPGLNRISLPEWTVNKEAA